MPYRARTPPTILQGLDGMEGKGREGGWHLDERWIDGFAVLDALRQSAYVRFFKFRQRS